MATVYMQSKENEVYKKIQQLKLICFNLNDNFGDFWLVEIRGADVSRRSGYTWGAFGALRHGGGWGAVTRAPGATETSEAPTPSGRC